MAHKMDLLTDHEMAMASALPNVMPERANSRRYTTIRPSVIRPPLSANASVQYIALGMYC